VCESLSRWAYTTCQIHGGMNPHERYCANEKSTTEKQICVATEAAGEGINLQFCRLMINYDLPWNPTRLEQRLGRIHRIGQERDVHAFNFVASASEEGQPIVEGRILERLLEKLAQVAQLVVNKNSNHPVSPRFLEGRFGPVFTTKRFVCNRCDDRGNSRVWRGRCLRQGLRSRCW